MNRLEFIHYAGRLGIPYFNLTADEWAAERAHHSGRGFYPWPNTARYCGLI